MITTHDFLDGRGPVPAKQHPNGGGWVADSATVAASAYVGPEARVFGSALVYDRAQVCGEAQVYGSAQVCGEAQVYGSARVFGEARVYGEALVYDRAQVCGEAQVYGSALVFGEARVCDRARVFGSALVYDRAQVEVTPPMARRSDGYQFTLLRMAEGPCKISAGCRFFTFAEARDHWKNRRQGEPLQAETFAILRFLRKRAIQLGWVVK